MSKIDYQALREAAQNAKDLGGIKNYKRGEKAVAEFESLITPHIVLELLDERERKQQYIKSRDQENEDIALTVGKLRVELEAAERQILKLEKLAEAESAGADKSAASCVEWMKRCHDAEKRIAELESLMVPQLPQQAVMHDAATAIRACLDEFPEVVRDIVEECAAIAENACRADMPHGAEPETDNTNQQFESLGRGDK